MQRYIRTRVGKVAKPVHHLRSSTQKGSTWRISYSQRLRRFIMKRVLNLSFALFLGLSFATGTMENVQNISKLFSFPCPNQQFGSCPTGYTLDVLIYASDGDIYVADQHSSIS